MHSSWQFNHIPIKIKKLPFANDWNKDLTERSSAFPRPWKSKKQGWEKKLYFSHQGPHLLMTEMKSKHGRQQSKRETCLLQRPQVLGRSIWHGHFVLNLSWEQATTITMLYSPLHIHILLNACFFRSSVVLLGEEIAPVWLLPACCALGPSSDPGITKCSGILTLQGQLHTQTQLQLKKEFERGISWHSSQ